MNIADPTQHQMSKAQFLFAEQIEESDD